MEEADIAGALAALGGLVALGGFIFTQWMKFQRQTLLYQKTCPTTSTTGTSTTTPASSTTSSAKPKSRNARRPSWPIISCSRRAASRREDALDRRIEAWLKETFGTDIDFECDDALVKLDRLGLLRRDGGRLSVLPLDEALVRLDRIWDNFFPFDSDRQPAPGKATTG